MAITSNGLKPNMFKGCSQRLARVIISLTILLTTLVMVPTSSWAADLLGSQTVDLPATLIGPRAKAPIPIYLRPAPNQPNVGYGINGDSVIVMEQLASFLPEADQDTAWNHIRLNHEPYTEGWIQGKFLSMSETDIQE